MRVDAGLFADGVPAPSGRPPTAWPRPPGERTGPYRGASPQRLDTVAAGIDPFPEEGAGRSGRDVAADGLGLDAGRYRVLCSELAHFSVARSATGIDRP